MSSLSPSDAVVAVRSFPRRFRGVLARPDDDRDTGGEEVDPDELARRAGPDGTSAAQHLLAADDVLGLLDRVLEQAVGHDDGLHPVRPFGEITVEDTGRPVAVLLDRLAETATGCAERIERVPTEEWGRRVPVQDSDGTSNLLELVQDGVDVVAGHLRAAERTIAAVT